MSVRAAEDPRTPGGPRCSMDVARDPTRGYCGAVRAPRGPDERGAVNVIELLFGGGRIAFFRIDAQQAEVRRLP